ncbi:unnamed protein product [Choristocarpus tenellus]
MIFDPNQIVYQIVALQCFHYAIVASLLGIFRCLLFGTQLGILLIFSSKIVSLSTTVGWTVIATHLLASLAG